jgi:hypothetical protein
MDILPKFFKLEPGQGVLQSLANFPPHALEAIIETFNTPPICVRVPLDGCHRYALPQRDQDTYRNNCALLCNFSTSHHPLLLQLFCC